MDVVTLAICRKLIASSATGITNIEVDENGDLVFTMADGRVITVDLPIKLDCVDVEFVDDLPLSGMEINKIYVKKTSLTDAEGNSIYRQYMWVNNEWRFIGISGEPIATTEAVGLVKPDGESILVDGNGTISVNEDFIYDKVNDNLVENTDIDGLFNN